MGKAIQFQLYSLFILSMTGVQASPVRPPVVAGEFYELVPFTLERQVQGLLEQAAKPGTTGTLVAAVVPHAGYVFAGTTAASVYTLLSSGQYDRVIILCPAHHVSVKGVSLPDPLLTDYSTPLGRIPIERDVCEALRLKKEFVTVPESAVHEHAIEVQLPLLQKTLRTFRLVPLICGPEGQVDVVAVSEALLPFYKSKTLLIASSDFTHFGPNYGYTPFVDNIPERLRELLTQASGLIAAVDSKGFSEHCAGTRDSICGVLPIKILLEILKKSGRGMTGQVLALASSGDKMGIFGNSVSYGAIGFFSGSTFAPGSDEAGDEEDHNVKERKSGSWTPGLSDAEKMSLFTIANDTLKWCVDGRPRPFDFNKYVLTPLLKTNMATFVTLKIHGNLRGCIGSLAPVEALYLSVHHNAVNAALRDPRFRPVQAAELPRLEVDVSILSAIRDIPTVADFAIGQQGIILEKGHYAAVYLPEVATEQGWTVEETLSSLSQKAGLSANDWREGARFKVFESVVLSEK